MYFTQLIYLIILNICCGQNIDVRKKTLEPSTVGFVDRIAYMYSDCTKLEAQNQL